MNMNIEPEFDLLAEQVEPDIDFVGEPVLTEALKIGYEKTLHNTSWGLKRQPNPEHLITIFDQINRLRGDFVYVLISSWEGYYKLYLVRSSDNFLQVELRD